MKKLVSVLKLILACISLYLAFTYNLKTYWSMVTIYWFLNFLTDIQIWFPKKDNL